MDLVANVFGTLIQKVSNLSDHVVQQIEHDRLRGGIVVVDVVGKNPKVKFIGIKPDDHDPAQSVEVTNGNKRVVIKETTPDISRAMNEVLE